MSLDVHVKALLDQMSQLGQSGQRGRPGDKARGGQAGADKT